MASQVIAGFFRRFGAGAALCRMHFFYNLSRVFNVLETIEGSGGIVIDKPAYSKGYGWRIRIDGNDTQQALFPYGPKWTFGLNVVSDSNGITTVTIWNPLVQRQGITTTSWFSTHPSFSGVPDRTCLTETINIVDWARDGAEARIYVAYRYDVLDNTGIIVASSNQDDVSTLPSSGSSEDTLRYYLLPLYILQADYTDGIISKPSIYIDCVHGVYNPVIY